MEFLLLYALFSITTSLAALYELMMPVISIQEQEKGKVEYKYLMYFTFILVSILIAPLIFLSCIIPSMGVRFRIAMREGLFPQE